MLNNVMLIGGDYTVKLQNFIYASFDLCAIILGVVVLINYIVSKKIHGRTTHLFLTLAICTIVSSVLDFTAVIALSVTGCPVWLGNLLVAINYLGYNVTGVVFVVYAVAVIYDNARIPRWCYAVANVLFVMTVAGVIFATVSLFTYGHRAVPNNIKYAYEGIIYGSQIIALAFSLSLGILQRKNLSKTRQLNIYFFAILNIIAILIQFLSSLKYSINIK